MPRGFVRPRSKLRGIMHESNLQAVKAIYQAMERGDVPGILEMIGENVEWGYEVVHSDAPWHTTVRGRHAVPRYFGALLDNVKVLRIEPLEYSASGAQVVARVKVEYTVRRSGRRVSLNQVHWWTFDQGGRVVRLWHWEDTAAVRDAWLAEPAETSQRNPAT